MNQSANRDENGVPLPMVGALTVQTAESWRTRLLEQLDAQRGLTLDLAGVAACDTIGVQLLCAARKSAIEAAQPFALLNPPEVFSVACRRLGLSFDSLQVAKGPKV